MPTDVPYYLLNFERALAWVAERYGDLFSTGERAFFEAFAALPQGARALLVRMLMRKGTLFRASRLSYEEIGCPLAAAQPLIELGWLDSEPLLTLDELFALATRPEVLQMFPSTALGKQARKSDLLDALRTIHDGARSYAAWGAPCADPVFRVTIAPLCDRLRLMFFGNLHQDWSEFVLADLGVFKYESVPFSLSSRAFQRRADIDAYLALHACREALDAAAVGEPVEALVAAVLAVDIDNAWLETRRAKLLFRIGQHAERRQDWDAALSVFACCAWPGARHRRMRVLERCGRFDDALTLALQSAAAPESEEESQRIARMLPRLQRHTGKPVTRAAAVRPVERSSIELARPAAPITVEYAARDALSSIEAPVHYVENALINSLFGLLCWEPVFAAIPGAFFHPFQRSPADLHAPDFRARRAEPFGRCLAQLDDGMYRETILRHLESKAGVQSPFVFWDVLTPELVAQALDCLPAAHLKLWFERLLGDIRSNRSGLPDLIRFWPAERRYELIEVKGPGDRLQDNQIRWLQYCVRHGMPARVLDVRWTEAAGAARREMTNGPHAHCRSLPPEGADASLGAARREMTNGPHAHCRSLPPEGADASLGAARREAS
ncbi:VRR-NUC domain-containing protein [Trinickia mobilis]|uniref:VRR-NUC domain-containing protein n=1 Tax=Trinickia mobilis TaxID=2816356 RepID=UPI001A8F91F9|nr:VRR-NUC domain-containing protein [Trinickia mobilis]